jgi:hypothetical protein
MSSDDANERKRKSTKTSQIVSSNDSQNPKKDSKKARRVSTNALALTESDLLKDTDGTNCRGCFLQLADNDRKVLVMLHQAYKEAESTNKLRAVGTFKNLLHFPLEDPGFPAGRGHIFSSFNKGDSYDVRELEKFISGKIQQELLRMGCKFCC